MPGPEPHLFFDRKAVGGWPAKNRLQRERVRFERQVYRRFNNRQDIVRALLRRMQDELRARLGRWRTIEEMAETYLDYALSHPHEYQLFYASFRIFSPASRDGRVRPLGESRPNLRLMESKLAEQLGGSPADHTRLGLALWAAAHGTATMLITKAIPAGHEAELRAAFAASVKAMLREASGFR